MRFSTLTGYAAGAALSVALLAGCSGGSSTSSTPLGVGPNSPATQSLLHQGNPDILKQTSVSIRGYVAPHPGPQFRNVPQAKGQALVYVSDAGVNEVFAFKQTGGSPVETISSGLSEPQGLATDENGTLYVANTGLSQVLAFKSGKTTPYLTVNTSGEYPVGVQTDDKGNMWVTNIVSTSGGAGNLQEYDKKGKLLQTITCTQLQKYYFDAIDKSGNVFVDGFATLSDTGPAVVEIKAGSTTCTSLPPTFTFPGGLQIYKKKDLSLDDQSANGGSGIIYTYAAPTFSKAIQTTSLSGTSDPVDFAFQMGEKFIWTSSAGNGEAFQFAFPAGGSPTITLTGFSQSIGVAVYPVDEPNG